jgi:hypothetical protein
MHFFFNNVDFLNYQKTYEKNGKSITNNGDLDKLNVIVYYHSV